MATQYDLDQFNKLDYTIGRATPVAPSWIESFEFNQVELKNVSFPPDYRQCLQTLEGLGLHDPNLVGGALRDAYVGVPEKVKDLDVVAMFNDPANPMTPEEADQKLREILVATKGVSDVADEKQINPNLNSFRLAFKYNGRDVDLVVFTAPEARAKLILDGDATISSIRMNVKGEVFAHPLFEQHATNRQYSPIPNEFFNADEAEQKFHRLAKKIPGLSMTEITRHAPESFHHPEAGIPKAMSGQESLALFTAELDKQKQSSITKQNLLVPPAPV